MKDMKLEIRVGKDFWTQSKMYYGYKNGMAYTEGYDTKGELIDDYPEFSYKK